MVRVVTKLLILLVLFYALPVLATVAKSIKSSFNGHRLSLDQKGEAYSFWLGGHLLGAHGKSVYPSASLLANIDKINASGADFFVSLGDIYRRGAKTDIVNYLNAFAFKLDIPLFNAVGNWDIINRQFYEDKFGKTYYSFIKEQSLFLFVDSELNNRNIEGEQLDFVLNALRAANDNDALINVFVFSHGLLWVVNKPEIRSVLAEAGLTYSDKNYINYETVIEPVLIELSKNKKVFLFSGDLGPYYLLPIFYEKDTKHDITYVANGIGDTERDVLLYVTVDASSEVTITPVSLTYQQLLSVQEYGLTYWKNHYDKSLVIYLDKTYRLFTDIRFWIGFLVSFPVMGVIIVYIKKKRK